VKTVLDKAKERVKPRDAGLEVAQERVRKAMREAEKRSR